MNQHKIINRLLLLLLVVMAMGVSITALVGAQNEKSREPEVPANRSQPISTNIMPTYYFTGVRDSQNSTNTSATVAHCTNLGTAIATVTVYMIDWDASPVVSGTITIGPYRTATYVSHSVGLYDADVTLNSTPDDLNQGYGWVVSSSGDEVICTVQVIDPAANPTYVVKLALYNSSYQLITPDVGKTQWEIYLPITQKK